MCEGAHDDQDRQLEKAAAVSVDSSCVHDIASYAAESGGDPDLDRPHATATMPCQTAPDEEVAQDLTSNCKLPGLDASQQDSERQEAQSQNSQRLQCSDDLVSRWASYDPLLEFAAIAEQSRQRQQARSAQDKNLNPNVAAVRNSCDATTTAAAAAAAAPVYTSISDRKSAYMAAAKSTVSNSSIVGSSAAELPAYEMSVAARRNKFATAAPVTARTGKDSHEPIAGQKTIEPLVTVKGSQLVSSAATLELLSMSSLTTHWDYRSREVAEMAAALLQQHSLSVKIATVEPAVELSTQDAMTG